MSRSKLKAIESISINGKTYTTVIHEKLGVIISGPLYDDVEIVDDENFFVRKKKTYIDEHERSQHIKVHYRLINGVFVCYGWYSVASDYLEPRIRKVTADVVVANFFGYSALFNMKTNDLFSVVFSSSIVEKTDDEIKIYASIPIPYNELQISKPIYRYLQTVFNEDGNCITPVVDTLTGKRIVVSNESGSFEDYVIPGIDPSLEAVIGDATKKELLRLQRIPSIKAVDCKCLKFTK